MSKAVLLVNLGSPDSTATGAVRRYLNEFLMDRRVIDMPWPLRRLVVGLILINRPRAAAHAYRKIWTPDGSPLGVTSQRLQVGLHERVLLPVELASLPPKQLVELAGEDLRVLLGVQGRPVFTHHHFWPRAIPRETGRGPAGAEDAA